jgi:hypothetical protein
MRLIVEVRILNQRKWGVEPVGRGALEEKNSSSGDEVLRGAPTRWCGGTFVLSCLGFVPTSCVERWF